ncbi:caspase, EACC1-associated type [Tenggerimyces flavus]|uniref:Caspase family protein n=1 Tax=Tenggerimyces flavus TaxID=1708749 RepID=A0ABV7YKY7_9ACTN|nr:caspase family protein [Tenggerimyces flavus]MBM7789686.1 hypothetical protein [Tenggerimyces flavus]
MREKPTSQFVLRVAAEDDSNADEVVEAIALELRPELADAGVLRMEQVPLGRVPQGARGLSEIVGVCSFVITAVQTGESMARAVAAVRRVVDRYARRRQRVQVTIAGVDVDLAADDDVTSARIVQALLDLPTLRAAGTRDALVIANAHYDDPGLTRLRSPSRDADELANVLGDGAIGGFQVDKLVDADERSIRRRIATFFADRDRDDLLLLHFSCHGVKDTHGRLHLATRDTDLSMLGATSIPASFVHDALSQTQSRRVVLILDCCYSGAFARGTAVRSGSDVHVAEAFGTGTGRIVLTASSATEYAFEDGELTQAQARPSVFTAALVEGLRTGAADLDEDGEISIDELYDYTYRRVRQTTPNQAPMKWSFGVEGHLVVARSPRPAALPQTIVDDLASDRVVLRLEAVRALAKLSASERSGIREMAAWTLARLRDTDDSVQVRRAVIAALAGGGREAEPEPAVEETPSVTTAPAVAPRPYVRDRPAVRQWSALLLAACVLVSVSVALYAVATYGIAQLSLADDWFHNLIWFAQLAGAGLLLVTRRVRWAWFLIGVLAWAWVDLAPTLQSSARDSVQDAWGFMITADLLAIAAQLCLIVAVARRRPANPARVAAAALVGTLALATNLVPVPLIHQAWHLDAGYSGVVLVAAGMACALVMPFAVLVARADHVGAFLSIGWLAGGAELGLAATVSLFGEGMSDGNSLLLTTAWILLVATAAAGIAASRSSRST